MFSVALLLFKFYSHFSQNAIEKMPKVLVDGIFCLLFMRGMLNIFFCNFLLNRGIQFSAEWFSSSTVSIMSSTTVDVMQIK